MKIIVTCPVKNEEWVLRCTLKNFSSFADLIIVADQSSTDATLDICKEFEKVKVIHNPFKGYTNEVRFMLLDEARKIGGEKLIICLDADEQIAPEFINEIKQHINSKKDSRTVSFYTDWLQMYGSTKTYRVDGIWKNNYKTFAFFDDPSLDYDRHYVTQEHIPRVPNTNYTVQLETPIIHLQWLARKRSEVKQALYMCNERVENWDPRKTNNRYSVAKFLDNLPLETIQERHLHKVYFPSAKDVDSFDIVKLNDMLHLFKKHGSLFFEPLDIWHIQELREYFEQENGRKPFKIKVFPAWLIGLNNIKNKIRYAIKLWYTDLNIFK